MGSTCLGDHGGQGVSLWELFPDRCSGWRCFVWASRWSWSSRADSHVWWMSHPVGIKTAGLWVFVNIRVRAVGFHSFTDAMVLGEPVAFLEGNKLSEGDKVLYGDNQSGLRLLESPDGPWRTRHLRLRSFVLRERMRWGLWKGRHVPGAQLASDLLTKAVTASAKVTRTPRKKTLTRSGPKRHWDTSRQWQS